jgi:hypothetical protein
MRGGQHRVVSGDSERRDGLVRRQRHVGVLPPVRGVYHCPVAGDVQGSHGPTGFPGR